jgi:5-methylcytosine-specific restriction endonuclease McrA
VKPGATDAEVIEAALDALLAQAAKRKGLTDRPRKMPRVGKGDDIPAHVKRAVWARDGGCCQWRLESGGICGSTYQLEFDHRRARALGGPPTIENIRLLCKFHNQCAARQTFGDAWMDRFRGKANRRPRELKPVAALATPEIP